MVVTMNESRIIFLVCVQCVRKVCSFDKKMYTRNEGWYSFRREWASGAHPTESMGIEFFNSDIDVHFTMIDIYNKCSENFLEPCPSWTNAVIGMLVTCWQNLHWALVGVGKETVLIGASSVYPL